MSKPKLDKSKSQIQRVEENNYTISVKRWYSKLTKVFQKTFDSRFPDYLCLTFQRIWSNPQRTPANWTLSEVEEIVQCHKRLTSTVAQVIKGLDGVIHSWNKYWYLIKKKLQQKMFCKSAKTKISNSLNELKLTE